MKLRIKVKPNSKEQRIEDKGDYSLVKLKSVAKGGKANEELLKVLIKEFGKQFKIKSGFTSRNKIVEEII